MTYHPASFAALSFHDARARFFVGTTSPAEYLDECLGRIRADKQSVRAWTSLRAEQAKREARESEARYKAGKPLSRIDGMPVGVKDLISTWDLPTTEGIRGNEDNFIDLDAPCIQALRAAGAIIVGKVTTTELGGGDPSPTRNPFDLARTPGGSSSGSAAAVGARMVPVAIGTQVAGSILRPSGYCANYAIKPSFGAIHRGDRASYSQSCIGIHAGDLHDMWNTLYEIAIRTGGDPGALGLVGEAELTASIYPSTIIRIEGLGWRATEGSTKAAFLQVIERLKRQGVRILDRTDFPEIEEFEQSLTDAADTITTLLAYENKWYLENLARRGLPLSQYTMGTLNKGRQLGIDDYRTALAKRQRMEAAFMRLRSLSEFFITPTNTSPAPLLDQPRATNGIANVGTGNPAYNLIPSLLRCPAISLPLLGVRDLPVGIQVFAQRDNDFRLCKAGKWIKENITPVVVE